MFSSASRSVSPADYRLRVPSRYAPHRLIPKGRGAYEPLPVSGAGNSRFTIGGVHRDTSAFHHAHDGCRRNYQGAIGRVTGQGKSSRIAVSAAIQSDQLADVGGAGKRCAARAGSSNRCSRVEIPTQRKVIELIGGRPDLLPYAHAELAGCRSTKGIQKLRSIVVPLHVPLVDRRAVGNAVGVALCGKTEFPQTHDPGVVEVSIYHLYKRRADELR